MRRLHEESHVRITSDKFQTDVGMSYHIAFRLYNSAVLTLSTKTISLDRSFKGRFGLIYCERRKLGRVLQEHLDFFRLFKWDNKCDTKENGFHPEAINY